MREPRITARKYEGDDAYSWAVFVDDHPFVTGISRSQVPYYKKRALEAWREKQLGKRSLRS